MFHDTLPKSLPVFPLSGAILLPRGHLPLNIFEPRYLQMVEDCLKTSHRMIVMVQPNERAGDGGLSTVACAGRLTSFAETEDRKYMVTLTGQSRCHLGAEHSTDAPYRIFDVDWSDFKRDLGPAEQDGALNRDAFFGLLQRYFRDEDTSIDWDSMPETDDEMLINGLSMLCPLRPEDKQALLEAPTLTQRREVLGALMEFALYGGNNKEMM
jgi:Lon protease-like protein